MNLFILIMGCIFIVLPIILTKNYLNSLEKDRKLVIERLTTCNCVKTVFYSEEDFLITPNGGFKYINCAIHNKHLKEHLMSKHKITKEELTTIK